MQNEIGIEKNMSLAKDGKYTTVKGRKIFYREWGEGKPILCIHGNLANSLWYSHLSPLDGFRFIALDLPNFGFSDPAEEASISCYADYLEGFIDELGLQEIAVIAHSLSAAVIYELLKEGRADFSKILLVDPCPLEGIFTPDERLPLMDLFRTNQEMLYPALMAIMPTITDEKLRDVLLNTAQYMDAKAYRGHALTLRHLTYAKYAKKLQADLLVLRGDQDPLVSDEQSEAIASAYGGSYLKLKGIGHSPMVEDPQGFRAILSDFLN
jgi:pimeloyl-ACP methyl ester carboxylesterase